MHIQKFLEFQAYRLRVESIMMTSQAGSGHPTSCLSAADLVAALFFYGMKFDPNNFNTSNNDRFILSKGHAAPLLYAVWDQLGCLSEPLEKYRQFGSTLEGHPTRRFAYAQAATGSLGIGLSVGLGCALGSRISGTNFYTYVLMGDGEVAEGSVWESAELAAYYKLSTLVALVDCNGLGQTGPTLHAQHAERLGAKFKAFGWHTHIINGHDMTQIMHALDGARSTDIPTAIIAQTVKGKGIPSLENKNGFHGKAFDQETCKRYLEELETRYYSQAHYHDTYDWQPRLPDKRTSTAQTVQHLTVNPTYEIGSMIATRQAYGQALVDLGAHQQKIIVLDAEVSNSTYSELFKKTYPERFIECFIAEQNMIGVAIGLDSIGYIPYASTFGAFFSRAYDQLRMAAIGQSALRCCGSHAGVSVGADGPSQMALEDIATISALPNSILMYPCDGPSTYALTHLMVGYKQGISYIKTTRQATPVIYTQEHQFSIGGCHILRQSDYDQLCIIAAGITVHEALKAADHLATQGIHVSVVDAYSIKPLATDIIKKVVAASDNKLITVEDHYLNGGLGFRVLYELRNSKATCRCLAVTQVPQSGSSADLLSWANIDAAALITAVHAMLGK